MTDTLDGRTAQFGAAVLTALPRDMTVEEMKNWSSTELKVFLGGLRRRNIAPTWYEEAGVIRFSVTSDGTTGEDWIKRLENKVVAFAKSVLLSKKFVPTTGVTTEVAVLKGTLFGNSGRVTKNIRAEGGRRNLTKPNAEVACLIREKFSDEEIRAMGLWWIIVMHEPIDDSDGDPFLLGAQRNETGRWLGAYRSRSDGEWTHDCGFAFVVSQVQN